MAKLYSFLVEMLRDEPTEVVDWLEEGCVIADNAEAANDLVRDALRGHDGYIKSVTITEEYDGLVFF